MDILNYPTQSNDVRRCSISCEFCSQHFGTIAEKNAHILDHFEQSVCARCDQNLLRIGDNYYILHATLTCISSATIKHEQNELDERNDHGISVIEVHPIDAKQYDNIFMAKAEINDASDQPDAAGLDSIATHIERVAEDPRPFSLQSEVNDQDIGEELEGEVTNTMLAAEIHVDAFNSSPGNEGASKLHESSTEHNSNSTQAQHQMDSVDAQGRYSCSKCGSTNLTKASYKNRHQNPTLECHKCGMVFCRFLQLKDHYELHPGADPYDGINLITDMSIGKHKARRKMKIYPCPVDGCNEMVSTSSRRHHMAKEHQIHRLDSDIRKKISSMSSQIRQQARARCAKARRFKCDKCGTSNISKETLKRHHDKQNFECEYCDRRFCLRAHLKQHLDVDGCGPNKNVDAESQVKDEFEKEGVTKIMSPDENQTVAFDSLPVNEQASELPQLGVEGGICNINAANSSQIQHQMYSVDVQGRYSCKKCGSTNLTEATYKSRHQNPTLECHKCDMVFCRFLQLKDHYKLHPGADPYDGINLITDMSIGKHKARRRMKIYQCPVDGCSEMVSTNSRRYHMAKEHQMDRVDSDIRKQISSSTFQIRQQALARCAKARR